MAASTIDIDLRVNRAFRLDAKALASARASKVLAIDPGLLGGSLSLLEQPPVNSTPPDSVAVGVVSIDGPIAQRGQAHMCGFLDGYDYLAERFAAALEDPEVGAVVLRIDSPGGDVAGLEEAVRRMQEAKAASGKQVHTYVDEQAASAAYWLAAALSDSITLPVSGEVGSIGCIGAYLDESEALAKDGIGVHVVRDPEGKAATNPLSPVHEIAEAQLREKVHAASMRFAQAVASARRVDVSAVRTMNAAMFEGEKAVTAKLADRVGSFESVLNRAAVDAGKWSRMKDETEKLHAQLKAQESAVLIAAELANLTGEIEPDAIVAKAKAWRDAAAQRAVELAKLEAERASREDQERVDLVAKLVVLGWETPATAWSEDEEGNRRPSAIYASTPIAALRARVEVLEKQPRSFGEAPKTAAPYALTERELRICKETNCDPQVYAARKARRESEARQS